MSTKATAPPCVSTSVRVITPGTDTATHINEPSAANPFEYFAVSSVVVSPETATLDNPKNTLDLNGLYHRWNTVEASNLESCMESLLRGVRYFATHSIWKDFSNLRKDVDDIAQTVTIKVYDKLKSFAGTAKFTTWVYQIIQSTAVDFYRLEKRRHETAFNDGEAVESVSPSARASSKKPSLAVIEGSETEDGVDGNYISKQQKDTVENTWNTDLDTLSAINRLNADDKRLIELVRQGYDGNEIGKLFNCSAKKIYNRYNRVIKLLECEVVAYSVLLHTCNPEFEVTHELRPDARFISDGKKPVSYRALPQRCRCRKEVTRAEAFRMEESGSIQFVFKLKNGKIVVDEKQVWAERAVRVPRVGATNVSSEKYAAGDKTSRRNLDIAHELSTILLRELMTGPTETIRHPVSGNMIELPTARAVDESKDVWRGQVYFVAWTDKRTKGGRGKTIFLALGVHIPSIKTGSIKEMIGAKVVIGSQTGFVIDENRVEMESGAIWYRPSHIRIC